MPVMWGVRGVNSFIYCGGDIEDYYLARTPTYGDGPDRGPRDTIRVQAADAGALGGLGDMGARTSS